MSVCFVMYGGSVYNFFSALQMEARSKCGEAEKRT